MHQADGDKSKAAAALFILALCEKDQLEAHKAHVAGFCKGELLSLILEDKSADKLIRFRAIWIAETFAMFLDKEDLKKVLHYYGKILTSPSGEGESQLIRAASCMAIFRYLSEADTDDDLLTQAKIKDMIGLEMPRILKLFLEYMQLYPELLEFPSGVQNLMTLFFQDLHYDLPLLTQVCEVFG